jgi:hypothetical protein
VAGREVRVFGHPAQIPLGDERKIRSGANHLGCAFWSVY